MANTGAVVLLIIVLRAHTATMGQPLVKGKAEPVQYISFHPNTYNENSYNVTHSIGNCSSSRVRVDSSDVDAITCPYGELLLDGITQVNLEDDVTNSDIQRFYTWEEKLIPTNEAFVTLQFPNMIKPIRVEIYCLESRDLRVRSPKKIKLYSSTTDSIYPADEIKHVHDKRFTVVRSGKTSNDYHYEYRRYDMMIPEISQVPLNYLRLSLDFEGVHRKYWLFISEVAVYHLLEPNETIISTSTSSSPTISVTTTSTVVTPSSVPKTRSAAMNATSVSFTNTITTSTVSSTKSATMDPTNNINIGKSKDVSALGIAAATTAGVLLLVIAVLLFVTMLFYCTRKRSRKMHNIDDKQQNRCTADSLSHCDQDVQSQELKIEPLSRLETVNEAYISAKVKSLDSLLLQHGHCKSFSDAVDYNVNITPNPSYNFASNSPQTKKEPEQLEYDYTDYVQLTSTASAGICGKAASNDINNVAITDFASDDNVTINPNPSYSLPQDGQDVQLQDNPSYNKCVCSEL